VAVTSSAPLLCAAAGAGKIGTGEKGGIVFKHRTTPGHEIYFLANTLDRPVEFTASLRVAGRKPQLWNAVSGAISDAAAFAQRDGRTDIPLRLDASESVFVVFGDAIRPRACGAAASNTTAFETVAALEGPWTVRFQGQGAPAETVFEALTDWVKHPDATLRTYGGAAVYETTFALAEPETERRIVLELGRVGEIATVAVNGREAGVVWTAPWEIDISGLATAGTNALTVRVANNWHNRLVADAALPPEERVTHVTQPYRPAPAVSLQASGLLGPVRIKVAE
jgi:hypothetical protein